MWDHPADNQQKPDHETDEQLTSITIHTISQCVGIKSVPTDAERQHLSSKGSQSTEHDAECLGSGLKTVHTTGSIW